MTDRFDGWIAGVGTASGLRAVVGRWPRSPLGPFADVMVERADGHRLLLAPSERVAGYVAATYRFDEVRIVPVTVAVDGAWWRVDAGPLDLRFLVGGRTALGVLLRTVPPSLATRAGWIRAAGPAARLALPGVRTHGTAGGGRREFYGALDLRRIAAAGVRWEGADQGALAPVDPPVRFGFGSTPAAPSLVRIVTLVRGAPPFRPPVHKRIRR
ncbi:hypothetical protein [Miltoncostaea marina]|uniref:hypothetical protein n=1 Tax=Miltoncostaea marina TaxID=2843215 RepID=UPI001C3D5ABF|nr:hypothetical protein [Miltoncostaea marina]